MRFLISYLLLGTSLLAGPRPVAPTGGAETIHVHPHLSWTQVYEPVAAAMPEYEVQIAGDPGFERIIDEDSVAAVITRYVPAKALEPGQYHWRVRGRNAGGKKTPWSEAGSFSVVLPPRVFAVPLGATGAEIQAVLQKAAAAGPARVEFARGEYRVDPGEALIALENASGLVIDGGGSSFFLTGRGSFLSLKNCADIHIKGFEMDYAAMPHIAGKVVAVHGEERSVDLELLPGFPALEESPHIADETGGMVRNGDDFAMKNNQPLVVNTGPGYERIGERRYRLKAVGKADFAAFAVGDVYVKGPRGPAGFDVERSRDVAVTDCTMFMCLGIGFSTHEAERLRIINVRLKRREGRPIAVENGGHNHHDARIGPWVENCLFEHTGDDICHVNALVRGVKERRSPAELVMHGGWGIEAGDRLQFYDRKSAKLLSERTVVAVEAGKRSCVVTLDGDAGPVVADTENPGMKNYQGTQVFNANRQCNQFVWRHNRCLRGRRVGVLCKGIGGLIEKNVFQQLGGGAVEIWNAPYEGLRADGYVIRDNKMIECGLVRAKGDSRTLWIFNRFGKGLLHRNILIENNEVRDYPCRAMIVKSADEVVIRGNRISNTKFANYRNTPGVIEIEDCGRIAIQKNTIEESRTLTQDPVSIESTVEVVR